MNFLLQSYICMDILYEFFIIQFKSIKDIFPLSKLYLYALDVTVVLVILLYNSYKKYNF